MCSSLCECWTDSGEAVAEVVGHGCFPQVKALHGRMKQSVREATLEAYTKLPAGAFDLSPALQHV